MRYERGVLKSEGIGYGVSGIEQGGSGMEQRHRFMVRGSWPVVGGSGLGRGWCWADSGSGAFGRPRRKGFW